MNNLKKIGLTALAASLVSVSANAGEMSVSGGASLNASGFSGEGNNEGTSYTMGNQLTFTGGGELDNGLTVGLSFVIDQGDDSADAAGTAPFDSHSISIGSDSLGTLKFSGEGGASTTSAIAKTAAGNLWDSFDQESFNTGDGTTTVPDLNQTASGGDDSFFYTAPVLLDGLTATLSMDPASSDKKETGTGWGVNYTGFAGLAVHYAKSDVVGADIDGTEDLSGDNQVIKVSYAYGPVTVSASQTDHNEGATDNSGDVVMNSAAISYTVSDALSITYGVEESDLGTTRADAADAELSAVSFAYTTGGMTLSGKMTSGENLNYTTATREDQDAWTLGASFAF